MGTLKINQLKNQFVKDIATQCDIVKQDRKLEGKELSIFRERIKQAIDCNLLNKKDLVSDLWNVLGMDLDSKKAENAKNIGKNVYEMLDGYTNKNEYYSVTQYIKNLDSHTDDFLKGYQTRSVNTGRCYAKGGNYIYEDKEFPLDICEQIATEWFYDEKEQVVKTLCDKVIAQVDLFGDKNSPEYKTLKDIVKNQDIIKFAKSGVLDKCISMLVKTFKVDDNPDSLIDKIEKK